ncbi:MAG: hypothetical protein AAF402_02200 [Pseudomonadota bacterium]
MYHWIIDQYQESARVYHSLVHIGHCLDQLDRVADSGDFEPETIARAEMAIWMHDVIYSPGATDNESLSARYWQDVSADFASPEVRDQISEAINDTTHSGVPRSKLGKLVVDLDLSGMGLSFEKFMRDGVGVRRELSHLSDDDYLQGQNQFFERLIEKERIYHTDFFYNLYEASARKNITAVLNGETLNG